MAEMQNSRLYKELGRKFDTLGIIDTHEHLEPEQTRLQRAVDFSDLFDSYCLFDLIAAGMPTKNAALFRSDKVAIEKKWDLVKPFYPFVRNTGYGRSTRLAAQAFYGIDDFNSFADALSVTEQMRSANRPGLYKIFLQDKCHLKTAFVFVDELKETYPTDFFHFITVIDKICFIESAQQLKENSRILRAEKDTLPAYEEAIFFHLQHLKQLGHKGVKFLCAYYRSLNISPVSLSNASRSYEKISSQRDNSTVLPQHSLLLQDYLLNRILNFCSQLALKAIFHTGLQAFNRLNLDYGRPERLIPTLQQFPQVDFVLLHCGLPWTNEASVLAKHFPNVYLDMAWMHIISNEMSVQSLKTIIDLVPRNKVMGFGGDCHIAEQIYAHLCVARQNILQALGEKTISGSISEEDAQQWLEQILVDNAARLYML